MRKERMRLKDEIAGMLANLSLSGSGPRIE
jgi:uncharacterized protein YdcH (DUF465 family)